MGERSIDHGAVSHAKFRLRHRTILNAHPNLGLMLSDSNAVAIQYLEICEGNQW